MNTCEHCSEPCEAPHYDMCKNCWWDRDPRNEKNAPPMKKFRIEVTDTLRYVYEVEAPDEAKARFLVDYGRVEPISRDESSEPKVVTEIK